MAQRTLSINVELLTAQARKNGKKLADDLIHDISGISTKKIMSGTFDKGALSPAGIKDLSKELRVSRDILSDLGLDNVIKSSKMANDGFQDVDKMLGRTTKGYKKMIKFADLMSFSYTMNFLGIMFFGMALKRLTDQIMGSTLPLFMKLTEGQTESGMALTALSASWETLKFSVGSALAEALLPIIPTLIDIIGRFTDWTERFPKLTGNIILFSGILGGALFIVGQLVLAMGSIFGAIKGLDRKSTR